MPETYRSLSLEPIIWCPYQLVPLTFPWRSARAHASQVVSFLSIHDPIKPPALAPLNTATVKRWYTVWCPFTDWHRTPLAAIKVQQTMQMNFWRRRSVWTPKFQCQPFAIIFYLAFHLKRSQHMYMCVKGLSRCKGVSRKEVVYHRLPLQSLGGLPFKYRPYLAPAMW